MEKGILVEYSLLDRQNVKSCHLKKNIAKFYNVLERNVWEKV